MLIRLVILWLLAEQPLHGYRIKRILEEPGLRLWFHIEVGSIYAAIASLARAGYLEAGEMEQEGLRPARTRYRILPSGREYLRALLRDAWTDLPRLDDAFSVALASRSELSEEEITGLLGAREANLHARLDELERNALSSPAPEVVTRMMAITQAELEWLKTLQANSVSDARAAEKGME